MTMARDLLFNDGGRNLNDETREKLQFLNNTTLNGRPSNMHIKDLQNDKWVPFYRWKYLVLAFAALLDVLLF